MSYEKVRVLKISQNTDKDTGEVRTYVDFERLESSRFRISAERLALRSDYESLVGRDVLVPLSAGVFEGRPFWRLEGDGLPIPVPGRPAAVGGDGAKSLFPKTGTTG